MHHEALHINMSSLIITWPVAFLGRTSTEISNAFLKSYLKTLLSTLFSIAYFYQSKIIFGEVLSTPALVLYLLLQYHLSWCNVNQVLQMEFGDIDLRPQDDVVLYDKELL